MNDQDEMFERATETPAVLGCPQHMPTHLPCGFDGVEPAPKKRSDLEKMNDLLLERLRRIRRISDDAIMDVRTDEEHNKAFLAACTEIRKLVYFYKPRDKPVDPTAPEMKKEFKFGFLSNGVQMIRFASGPMVTLIGKRDRGPCERQGGRTDKVIYKVTVDREEKHASVYIDGVNKINFGGGSSGLLESGALAMLNCIISFNARQQRHKKARYNRRKAEAKKQ